MISRGSQAGLDLLDEGKGGDDDKKDKGGGRRDEHPVLLGCRKHDSPKKIVKVEKKDVGEVALRLS